MDNFMDKIAQKLSSQEAIRANSAADAAQMEKLHTQLAEYDACMKEMRKLNLKNVENEQKLQELMQNGIDRMNKLFEENTFRLQALADECMAKIQAAEKEQDKQVGIEAALEGIKETAAGNMEKIEVLFKEADDFVHKENVKVYRNVQAVVVEEAEKQTQALIEFDKSSANRKKSGKAFAVGLITLIVALANMGLLIAHVLGVF